MLSSCTKWVKEKTSEFSTLAFNVLYCPLITFQDFADTIPGHGGIMDRFDCQLLMGVFVNVYIASLIRYIETLPILHNKQGFMKYYSLHWLHSNANVCKSKPSKPSTVKSGLVICYVVISFMFTINNPVRLVNLLCCYIFMFHQGSTNLIFSCTDFRARKMVLRARSCTQNQVCIKQWRRALIYIV